MRQGDCNTRWHRGRVALATIALLTTFAVNADEPTLTFDRDAGANPLLLGTSGCVSGSTCGSFTVAASGWGACGTGENVQIYCRAELQGGTTGGLLIGNGDLRIACGSTATQTVAVSCPTPGSGDTSSIVNCNVLRLNPPSDPPDARILVTCPALVRPEFDSTPPAGNVFALTAPAGGSATATLQVGNSGQAGLTVGSGGLNGIITITPGAQQTIAPGGAVDYTLHCAPTVAGTAVEQSLVLATNDADEAQVSYVVRCSAPALPSPEFESTPLPPILTAIDTTRPTIGSTSFNVVNVGTGTLTVNASGLAAPFSIDQSSASVAPNAAQNFTIACNSTTPGSYGQYFSLQTNDADEASVQYYVSCLVRAPAIATVPAPGSAIGLAAQTGTGTVSSTIVVANQASANGNLQFNVETTGPPFSATPISGSLAPGNSTNVSVSCNRGAAAGGYDGNLVITSNDATQSPTSFPLRCDLSAATAPEFSSDRVPPGPLTISAAQGSSATRTLTVSNAGTAALNIAVASNPAGPKIAIAPDAAAGTSALAPGTSKVYTVSCDAASAGSFTDSFVLSSNDSDESSVLFDVACTVTPTTPRLSATPAAPGNVSLSAQQGAAAPTATLAISNTGSATLVIGSISGLAAPLAISPVPSNLAIAPGATQVFTLSCATGSAFSGSRSFTVNSNDPTAMAVTYVVNCTITPLLPAFTSSPLPNSTSTQNMPVGASSSALLTIGNAAGQAPLTIIASGLSAPLSISPATPSPLSVPVGGSAPLLVICAPTAGGKTTQTLTLTTNDPLNSVVHYTMVCTGLAPEFDALPPTGRTLALFVTPGASASTAINISNSGAVGSADLVVTASGLSGALSVSPDQTPVSIPAGSSANFNVTCSDTLQAAVGQTLTLAHNDLDESPATYIIQCSRTQLPEVNNAIKAYLAGKRGPLPNAIFQDGFE